MSIVLTTPTAVLALTSMAASVLSTIEFRRKTVSHRPFGEMAAAHSFAAVWISGFLRAARARALRPERRRTCAVLGVSYHTLQSSLRYPTSPGRLLTCG